VKVCGGVPGGAGRNSRGFGAPAQGMTPARDAAAAASPTLATVAYSIAHGFRLAWGLVGATRKSTQREGAGAAVVGAPQKSPQRWGARAATATGATGNTTPRPADLDTSSSEPAETSTHAAGRNRATFHPSTRGDGR